MPAWNPEKYLAHAALHMRPTLDLVHALRISPPHRIVDLGCGPGNSAEDLHRRWPEATIAGVDSSPEMLAQARTAHPDWSWIQAGIEEFAPRPGSGYDLVFSSSALQWVPNHDRLLPQLWSYTNAGGALAIQMPANQASPFHRAVFQTANLARWRPFTEQAREVLTFQPPEDYLRVLQPLTDQFEIWESIYYQLLDSLPALLDWGQTTVLRPFLARIPQGPLQEAFLCDIAAACKSAYPPLGDGKIVYAQKRLFLIAYKEPS